MGFLVEARMLPLLVPDASRSALHAAAARAGLELTSERAVGRLYFLLEYRRPAREASDER